jgi:hypothetical protein
VAVDRRQGSGRERERRREVEEVGEEMGAVGYGGAVPQWGHRGGEPRTPPTTALLGGAGKLRLRALSLAGPLSYSGGE